MAYKALYRKYRPQTFDQVVGQRFIVQTLQNAVRTGRIAHAYLFCGPRGTGKTSIAKIFARALNCTGENKPCLECDNCRMSLDGSHPDIFEIDAASNNGVDEVRSLIERVDFAPMEGRYKIYIIDEVHMMTTGAFNALLKTIEEPPEHVIFIFATTEPNKVLPTILSRCQRYDFSKVCAEDISSYLKYVCKSEGVEIDDSAAALIASLADGGMRDSLSILDQCISYEPEHVSENHIREIYGIVTDSDIADFMMKLASSSPEEAIAMLHNFSDEGMDLRRFTSSCISLLKDSLLLNVSARTTLLSDERKKLLSETLLGIPSGFRIGLLNSLMDLFRTFNYASNILDYLDTAFLEQALKLSSQPDLNLNQISESPSQRSDLNSQRQISSRDRSQSQMISRPSDQKSGSASKSDQTLAEKFWSSDVSRETINRGKDISEQSDQSETDHIALIAGCTKQNKNQDMSLITHVNDYMNDLKFAKYASKFRNSGILASAETYILLTVSSEQQIHELDRIQSEPGFAVFMNEVFHTPKRIFPVLQEQSRALTSEFVKHKKQGDLPSPAKVDLLPMESEENHEPTTEEILKGYFPDLIIKED